MTPRSSTNDDGLGLIELVVAMVVSGLVIAAIATILVNSWRTQEQVTSVTQATNRGQLVSSTIERAMRNALYFEVTESGTVLRVSTSLAGNQKCQGFRLTDPGAQFAADAAMLPSPNTTWPSWQTGITKQGTTPYFVRTAANSLTYTFKITTEASPVRFSADVAPRSLQESGSDGCW
ncbi:prepilin-type N-terminal cleavage/methylation domain-containing protein [Microbacterium sp. QXD-8]|uniref:Prepilin-type N-terminal cleavage/methylation domain-containing protein n=1 Tax=Microbacterium psychrotolerans TaxID=3068321 RepID=A0ABU0Z0J0_9MICO|nr:prepilin-type N-terminal cleavage/methylation domain-containing protein [Microbacterium sp. QXD-8]MDQ7878094.1 prepilin-type N-terminal cleavage/methylation domain-containing protein [Microbacterium sp. QXD-8]